MKAGSMVKITVRLALLAGAFGAGMYVGTGTGTEDAEHIVTVRRQGASVSHDEWRFTGKNVRFTTTAEGKGVSETTVPKRLIPEARSWMEKKDIIIAGIYCRYDREVYAPGLMVQYYRRFGVFGIGGGLSALSGGSGITLGMLYMF